MLTQEHAQTAQDFLAVADDEFGSGDMLQGSEKMWGAAAHAVMAVAQQRDWPFGSHGALRIAVRRLSNEFDDPFLTAGFVAAEKLHDNFYHDFMEHDADFELSKDVTRQFVGRVLSLMDTGPFTENSPQ